MGSVEAWFAFALFVFIVGLGVSSIAMYRRAGHDVSAVRGSAMLGRNIRGWYFDNLRPFEELFVRWHVHPSVLTYFQLVLAVFVAAAYARGLIFIGGWLVLCAGSLDILDGRVARRTNLGSPSGAFLDSVIDRYVDALGFLGLAAFYADSWMLWVVLWALLGALMVSYTRARAEGLGVECLMGFLQRPERYVILGFGSIFGSLVEHMTEWHVWGQPYGMVAIVVMVLAVFSNLTAVQRSVHVLQTLRGAVHE